MGKANSKGTDEVLGENPHSITQSVLSSQFKVPVSASADRAASEDPHCSKLAQFRNLVKRRFRQRMSRAGLWCPHTEEFPNYTSVSIFDWDDTLLCTTYLDSRTDAFDIQSKLVRTQLEDLDQLASQLLISAMAVSKTYVVTNALVGWVEYSASVWLPKVCEVLSRLEVVSARSSYEEEFPGRPDVWKAQAFLQTLEDLPKDARINFLCFGDSEAEISAAQVIAE